MMKNYIRIELTGSTKTTRKKATPTMQKNQEKQNGQSLAHTWQTNGHESGMPKTPRTC